MNTREEILEHLKEILSMEVTALTMYEEIAREINNAELKAFFTDFSNEEARHVKLVKEMMSKLHEGMQGPWHEPAQY